MSTTSSITEKPKRQHRTLDEARDLVTAWRGSGMGKEAWCRERGLLRSVLSSCLYRVEAADAAPTAPATFIPIRPAVHPQPELMEPPVRSRTVAIELPDGLRITGLDASGAATVVRLLRTGEP
jgi:hypothetical protein